MNFIFCVLQPVKRKLIKKNADNSSTNKKTIESHSASSSINKKIIESHSALFSRQALVYTSSESDESSIDLDFRMYSKLKKKLKKFESLEQLSTQSKL